MNIYAIINGINALCALAISCTIIIRKSKQPVHYAALLWYATLFAWTSTYYIWGLQKDLRGSLVALQILLYSCVSIHMAYFHFALVFCNCLDKYRYHLYAGYAAAVVFLFINAFNGFVDVSYTRSFPPFPHWPHASPLLGIAIGTQVLVVGFSFRIISKTVAISPEPLRTRIMLFHLTAAIAWMGGLTNWFQFYDVTPIPPFGNLGVLLYMIVGFYLLYKHDILSLNIVIKRTFTYAVLTLFISLVFTLSILLSERLFRSYLGYNSMIATVLAATTIALLFNPLRALISRFIDRRFFGKNIEALSSENERLQHELREQDKMRSIATLAAGMAHEIKNPLTSIKTFAQYLPEKYDDPQFREKFKHIMTSEVDRINNIVKQLLDFSKPQPPVLRDVSIHDVLDGTLDLLTNNLFRANICVFR